MESLISNHLLIGLHIRCKNYSRSEIILYDHEIKFCIKKHEVRTQLKRVYK